MTRTYSDLIGWGMILIVVNFMLIFTNMATDTGFRNGVINDLGTTFNAEYEDRLLIGDNQWKGFDTVVPMKTDASFNGTYDADLSSSDADLVKDDEKVDIFDYLESKIFIFKYLGRVADFVGLIVALFFGASFYMIKFSTSNVLWYYVILTPFHIMSLKVILKFIFPTRFT